MRLCYAVVFEQTPNNYCAYVPDLPGCISTGKTWDEIQEMIQEAITGHVEVMLEYGDPLPERAMSLEEPSPIIARPSPIAGRKLRLMPTSHPACRSPSRP